MRPVPIAPTLIRLLGAFAPSTEAGTIDGNPASMDDATSPPPADAMNSRRDGLPVISVLSAFLNARGAPPPRALRAPRDALRRLPPLLRAA